MRKFLPIFLISLFFSCYYDNEEELYPLSRVNCETGSVTYNKDILPIITKSCAISGCHVTGGTGNGNFESYAGVKAKVDNGSFENRVVINQNMPPNGSLSNCELDKIRAWLNLGAPNN